MVKGSVAAWNGFAKTTIPANNTNTGITYIRNGTLVILRTEMKLNNCESPANTNNTPSTYISVVMKKSGIIISQNPSKALPTAATGNTDFIPASSLRFAVAK